MAETAGQQTEKKKRNPNNRKNPFIGKKRTEDLIAGANQAVESEPEVPTEPIKAETVAPTSAVPTADNVAVAESVTTKPVNSPANESPTEPGATSMAPAVATPETEPPKPKHAGGRPRKADKDQRIQYTLRPLGETRRQLRAFAALHEITVSELLDMVALHLDEVEGWF